MPEGTALETTARVAAALASATLEDETVDQRRRVRRHVPAPYNFNGLVRHYFLRREPHLADLQVNLVPKDERTEQSHEMRGRVRERLLPIARARLGATIQVAEVPPGPPVLQTLVAEVYGPDPERRTALAARDQVDLRADARRGRCRLVRRGAAPEDHARRGRREGRGRRPVAGGGGGSRADGRVGRIRGPAARRTGARGRAHRAPPAPRPTAVSRPYSRSGFAAPGRLPWASSRAPSTTQEEASLYHKNLQPVTYVTGDVAGANESPVYAILQMNEDARRGSRCPRATALEIFNAVQPFDTSRYAMKWDGEWHITIEVFRDLGLAFAAVLRAHLHARGRLVPVVQDAADHHGRHPVLARRHPAGARGDGRVLHRDVDDRLHRRRGHRRAQFDHPRGLHRAAAARGHAARGGRRRCRRGALPPDGAHRGRRDRRRRR